MRAGLFFGFLIAVTVVLVGTGVWRGVQVQQEASSAGGRPPPTPVAVTEVERHAFADVVEALGTARANESIIISTQVTDIVSRVAFDSGDKVEQGQVLVELTDIEETADLAQARAAQDEAQKEYTRVVDLRERGVVAQSQIDVASSALDQARSRVRSVEARLADRIVRAPFAGVIGLRNTSVGALVRPGDEIATLDDISVIKLDFTVPERFLGELAAGEEIRTRTAAYEDATFAGVVTDIDSRVDPITRTVVVRAEIDNSDERLLPGMLMLVELRRNERESLVAPEVAVSREGEIAYVLVVREDENGAMVERRTVSTGLRSDGLLELTKGVEFGERIIAEGVHRVRPGQLVLVAGDGPPNQQSPGGRGAPGVAAGAAGGRP